MPSGNLICLSAEIIFSAKEYFLCLIDKKYFEMTFLWAKIKFKRNGF